MEIINNKPADEPQQPEQQTTQQPEPKSEQTSEPKRHPRHPRSTMVDVLALVGVFIVSSVVGGLIMEILKRMGSASTEFATFIGYIIQFGATIIFALWQRHRRGERSQILRMSRRGFNPTLILWGVVLVFVTSTVIEPLLNIFPQGYLDLLASAVGTGGWAMLTAVVAAPLLEEILFRGIIQDSLVHRYGALRGVVLAAAVFGIVHIIPQQVVNAFFVGLILGFIYLKTRSLVPVIIIHAINNALAFIFMTIFSSAKTGTRDLIGNDTLYWVFYAACSVVFVVAGINIFRQLRRMQNNSSEANVNS